MFFDIPEDPWASLRWVLTKLRAVVDEDAGSRILSSGDTLMFEPAGTRVDVLDVLAEAGIRSMRLGYSSRLQSFRIGRTSPVGFMAIAAAVELGDAEAAQTRADAAASRSGGGEVAGDMRRADHPP